MYVSVRDGTLLSAFSTMMEGLKAIGLSAVEVEFKRDSTVGSLTDKDKRFDLSSEQGIRDYERHLKENGVKVTALLVAQNWNADDVQPEIDYVVKVVEAAHRLGIKAVRIDSPHARDLSFQESVLRFSYAAKKTLEATAHTNVALGIENHGRIGNDPNWLDAVLEQVNHPRLGLTLDTGNFYWFGHPLSKLYEIEQHFAPRTKHTHVKNIAYPPELREQHRQIGFEYGKYVCPIPDGDIDIGKIASFLRAAGYDLDLCIEDESLSKFPPEQRQQVLKLDAEFLSGLV